MAAVSNKRQLEMTLNLDDDQVKIERCKCTDGLFEDFELEVDVMSTFGELDMLQHLGKPVAVHANEDDQLMRHFHGFITAAEFLFEGKGKFHYRLTARPFTYFLDQNADMAIFQDKTVPEIISLVMKNAGYSDSDFEVSASGNHPPRVYCVQYRESDWQFLRRLMQEEGLYYYYTHAASRHKLIVTDTPTSHQPGKPADLTFNPYAKSLHRAGSEQRRGTKHFLQQLGEKISSGAESMVTLMSFDLTKPEKPLLAQATDKIEHKFDEREIYDFHGRYVDEGFGRYVAERQLEAYRRNRQLNDGLSDAISLAAGTTLKVKKHPIDRLNQEYLITRTIHVIQGEDYYAADDNNDDEEATHVSFDAIPAKTPFRSEETIEKPRVQGLESAIVSGPEGEEIYTDEYGRVKVRFHWDRGDTPGEKSTCWVRVAQFGGLGNIILPRINQEVMIDFLHGDPDRPIVIGWVFNKSQMPVYPLPDHKTRAVWRSRSYMHGTSTKYKDAKELEDTKNPGANEIRFEDKSGEEEFFMHAEKDMNIRVRNDQTNHVAHNQYEKVYWDRDAFVGRDETTEITRNQSLKITKGNQTEEICEGNRSVEIKKGNDTLKVAMGNITVSADMGKIDIKAAQSITLSVGSNKITIDMTGVAIEGTLVKVKAGAMLQTEGPMIQQQASGVHIIKGGIVMIN